MATGVCVPIRLDLFKSNRRYTVGYWQTSNYVRLKGCVFPFVYQLLSRSLSRSLTQSLSQSLSRSLTLSIPLQVNSSIIQCACVPTCLSLSVQHMTQQQHILDDDNTKHSHKATLHNTLPHNITQHHTTPHHTTKYLQHRISRQQLGRPLLLAPSLSIGIIAGGLCSSDMRLGVVGGHA